MNAVTVKAVALLLAAACICMVAGCGGKSASEGVGNREASLTPAVEGQAAVAVKGTSITSDNYWKDLQRMFKTGY